MHAQSTAWRGQPQWVPDRLLSLSPSRKDAGRSLPSKPRLSKSRPLRQYGRNTLPDNSDDPVYLGRTGLERRCEEQEVTDHPGEQPARLALCLHARNDLLRRIEASLEVVPVPRAECCCVPLCHGFPLSSEISDPKNKTPVSWRIGIRRVICNGSQPVANIAIFPSRLTRGTPYIRNAYPAQERHRPSTAFRQSPITVSSDTGNGAGQAHGSIRARSKPCPSCHRTLFAPVPTVGPCGELTRTRTRRLEQIAIRRLSNYGRGTALAWERHHHKGRRGPNTPGTPSRVARYRL